MAELRGTLDHGSRRGGRGDRLGDAESAGEAQRHESHSESRDARCAGDAGT